MLCACPTCLHTRTLPDLAAKTKGGRLKTGGKGAKSEDTDYCDLEDTEEMVDEDTSDEEVCVFCVLFLLFIVPFHACSVLLSLAYLTAQRMHDSMTAMICVFCLSLLCHCCHACSLLSDSTAHA